MISVIMCVYNEPETYLKKSIESILNQTYSDFEYIIVLDKPDNEEALDLLKKYANKDERIRILVNAKNKGITESLNRALEEVHGEYIARIDADDIAELNRLEIQLNYLKNNNLDFIGSSVRRISETGEVVCMLTNQSYDPVLVSRLLLYDNCIPHPSWFLKISVYRELKCYRDIRACEDYDFLLRALMHGFNIGICDSITMNYRVNTKGISRNNSLRQLLSSDYLQNNINRIDDITQEEVENYINGFDVYNEQKRYEISLRRFNQGIEEIKRKKFIGVILILKSLLGSKYIKINLKKVLIMQKIKRVGTKYAKRFYR